MPVTHKPLVYIVDDDEEDRNLLKGVFTANFAPCTVRTFDGGSELLTQLTHRLDGRLPDLIILDLAMPVFSGFDLLRYVKQDRAYQSIPVVIVSGSQDTNAINRCRALGSTAYVTKTPDYQQLVLSIRQLRRYWSETSSALVVDEFRLPVEGLSFTELSQN